MHQLLMAVLRGLKLCASSRCAELKKQVEAAQLQREKEAAAFSDAASKVEADLRARLNAAEAELNRAKAQAEKIAATQSTLGNAGALAEA